MVDDTAHQTRAPWQPTESTSADPVIRHLENALDAVNGAMVDLGGSEMSQEIRISITPAGGARPARSMARSASRQLRRTRIASASDEVEEPCEEPPGWPSLRI